jgi:hypothetical protein
MSDEYQKNVNKLMSVDFESQTTISKIRTHLYNCIQTDVKTINYEF